LIGSIELTLAAKRKDKMHGQLKQIGLLTVVLLAGCCCMAQRGCPVNIGFEKGSFEGWECAKGTINGTGTISLQSSSPDARRHVLLQARQPQELDKWGGFPVIPPNGSEYAVRLGNDEPGAQAEQLSYTFTIPQDQNTYSIIYYYAVVFQDRGHSAIQQPKFTANVYDVDVGKYIGCSSFSYTASGNLPGFKKSSFSPDSLPVYYKEWTPVTIKLSGMAGRRISVEFTTNDCSPGGHFGYAYVDISQNCTSPISGNVYCASSEQIKLVAPYGFAGYKWFSGDFSKVLGQENTLTLKPVPAPNTKFAVEVTPFIDQGCMDTIYTSALFSPEPLDLRVKPQVTACITNGMDLTNASVTAGSGSNLSFTYFTDPDLKTFVPVPKSVMEEGEYYILAENEAGCTISDKLTVQIEPLPDFRVEDPANIYRPATIDLAKTVVSSAAAYNYSYWQDSLATKEVVSPHFIDKTGKYFLNAKSTIAPECAVTKSVNVKILDPVITAPNIFTPNGDGVNDTWSIPQLAYYPECVLEIFDRSGRKLWRSDQGYTKPWDGKYQGKDLPVDTYYFIIRLNSELANVSGSITIMR
jgi:gliding motility-associated-like protein